MRAPSDRILSQFGNQASRSCNKSDSLLFRSIPGKAGVKRLEEVVTRFRVAELEKRQESQAIGMGLDCDTRSEGRIRKGRISCHMTAKNNGGEEACENNA
jgi:hypothetical protein